VNLLEDKHAETHPTLAGGVKPPRGLVEQRRGIAIGNRWPFAHGCRCELGWSTRSEPRRSLEDRGYLGVWLTGVSTAWKAAWQDGMLAATMNRQW